MLFPAVIGELAGTLTTCARRARRGQHADFLDGLDRTLREVDIVWSTRPALALRDLVMPWHELCPESGLPVTEIVIYGSAAIRRAVLMRSRARERARNRLFRATW